MNSESGIVFFADGILARTFKSAADRLSDACLVIEQKNFFEDLHETVSYSEHRLCQWSAPARRDVTSTSETWEVMPMTNEKYAKSRLSGKSSSGKFRPPAFLSALLGSSS